METESTQLTVFHRWFRRSSELDAALTAHPDAARIGLGARELGEVVTDHRTSWVRRHRLADLDVFAKTYDYPGLGDRLRGVLRTTVLAPGRARREAQALDWLAREGFPAPSVLGIAEVRRRGWLRRSILFLSAWPGRRIDQLLLGLGDARRDRLIAATWRFVDELHAAGFVDGNLDPRNLLARPVGEDFELTKIDSPRHRRFGRGRAPARAIAADRARLAAQFPLPTR